MEAVDAVPILWMTPLVFGLSRVAVVMVSEVVVALADEKE